MTTPRIEVDLDKIRHNARNLVQRLGRRGIAVSGVTKAVCGNPDIAGAMLEGGVSGLADSRIENVERMRQAEIAAPISLLRPPTPGQANRIAQACTSSYNTEFDTIDALARVARRAKSIHGIVLMVEMGDMREGIMPDDLVEAARTVMKIPGVALKGIGANFACLGGRAPDARAMARLSALADEIECSCGLFLETVSGGNSASLPWAFGAENAYRINELRMGEAILLGVDPLTGCQIDGLVTDAFTLVAEVIESKRKTGCLSGSSEPPLSSDHRFASGHGPAWQSILAIGYQDTDVAGLTLPVGLASLGGTSDQLVIETSGRDVPIGTEIALQPNYSALMRVMNAPGVAKVMRNRRPQAKARPMDRNRPDLALA